ncbi:MAG: DNA helicase RecQ [Terrimicrobiaceae bacterium]
MQNDELAAAMRRVFGHDSFRSRQREIMEASLEGRDVFALLPTGGGKSLCFQLPAIIRGGLTVVVSPLIALMKDQVDQLTAAGVEATFLNSSLGAAAARERLRGLHAGQYRLLYAAPERLMMDNWRENLQSWDVRAVAIDEAHCISEWGHDFRPEYRQLGALRDWLPETPMMALTATATQRVREDIVKRLRLREPATFVASFFRPNLHYRVEVKDGPVDQITRFLKNRADQSGIVYCASRAATERVAESLASRGFTARPYHAGLSAGEREENQELFLRDEVRIICATIAFGMGINKPDVRWVVHYDLPKNVEGYYQETGRAGRDGLPSDCLLLFSAGDAAKQTHFIDQLVNEEEREVARRQLRRMLSYAEVAGCRWRDLLAYFGEEMEGGGCGVCDNCLRPREKFDGTVAAQKLLSCVVRLERATPFPTGLNHAIDVLLGSNSEKIRRWGHDRISTYGIGRELSRGEWAAVGRELISQGLLRQQGGRLPTISVSPEGLDVLKSRRVVQLTRPLASPPKPRRPVPTEEIECNEGLFHHLRQVRKSIADERGVPAYVILGDVSLRIMARDVPVTRTELEEIPGWGKKKLADFGDTFLEAIAGYLGR